MAGSWNKMVKHNGTPVDVNFGCGSQLLGNSDMIDTLEQCYGMIWYLSWMLTVHEHPHPVPGTVSRYELLRVINIASQNAGRGLEMGVLTDRPIPV